MNSEIEILLTVASVVLVVVFTLQIAAAIKEVR